MAADVIGLDIGGTKLAAGIVAPDGSLLSSARRPTPVTDDPEVLFAAVVELVGEVAGDSESFAGLGVGCAGPMRWPDGVVSPLNMPAWREFPLRARLAEQWPGLEVRVHNDAIAMACAEHWVGAARGRSNMVGMVVSTGVGGGLVIDDRVVNGGLGNAGHVGHIVVDPTGPLCVCGGRGCLEAIARGPATVAWALEQGWTPQGLADGVALAADARAGDEFAIAALRRSGTAVGIALASMASLLDLDVAVIGGGLAQSGELLFGPMREAFSEHAGMAFAARMEIVGAALGPEAGIVGATSLLLHRGAWHPVDSAPAS